MVNDDNGAWKRILERYLDGTCSEEERAAVERWYADLAQGGTVTNEMDEAADLAIIRSNLGVDDAAGRTIRPRMGWMSYAAACTLVIAGFTWMFIRFGEKAGVPSQVSSTIDTLLNDALPGRDRATLILGDGRHVILDEALTGEIAQESNVRIYKNPDNSLVYDATQLSGAPRGEVTTNTIRTPRGGQYQIKLPDGTQVWLNAASSLRYPSRFAVDQRVVTLEGEAFFDVAHDADRPFRVHNGKQTVEVLGTQFNVNSYPDEPNIKTTLLSGSVKVTDGTSEKAIQLKPGQQAVLHDRGISVNAVDVSDAIAWKEGIFKFENSDIPTVTRQLARWYDVEVLFRGTSPQKKLWGEAYRNANASVALQMLSYFGLDYRISYLDGKKTIVIENRDTQGK